MTAGRITVRAKEGVQTPLGADVPFAVELIEPPGDHTVDYRLDGKFCHVQVDGLINVVGVAALREGRFRVTYRAPGIRAEVVLHATS